MTNEQLVAFVIGNAAAIFAVLKWGTIRAIKYTHLERDVVELQKKMVDQDLKNDRVQVDLKGLSIKINLIKDSINPPR